MSKLSIQQFQEHTAKRRNTIVPPADVTGYPWPHLQPMTRTRPPASGGDISPKALRALAAEMRTDASRQLARANDLELAAKRLEGAL